MAELADAGQTAATPADDDDETPALFLTAPPTGKNNALAAVAALIDEEDEEEQQKQPPSLPLKQPQQEHQPGKRPVRKRKSLGEAQVTLALIGLEQPPAISADEEQQTKRRRSNKFMDDS